MTQTETKWSERVQEWRASGRTAEQFAHGRGFEGSTLRYWASRLKAMGLTAGPTTKTDRPTTATVAAPPVRMVRVRRAGRGPRGPSRAGSITIAIGGARVEVQAGFDRALLGEVIDALGGAR